MIIQQKNISRYETGASLPSIRTLIKIAKALKKPTKVPNQANAADAVNYPADLRRYLHRRIKYAKNVLDKYVLMMHNDACIIAYIWRCGP
ncbi:XRE family transcriptional regulator [Candidatus Aerophobetes bacterium]|uniref:XRE family transcriptional regulator n=1 Tax=Aerophobetes bacterium TaxID=2030807 RepID=A0A523TFP4_UNCAE|nr:MAG: XRE family transcriptional regulator [Candidatus Aerophobetes bacterium]